MTATRLEGRPVADVLWNAVAERAARFAEQAGRAPALAMVCGPDEAARAYARSIERAFGRRGITTCLAEAGVSADALGNQLAGLSRDDAVDGVLVLAPLPGGVTLDQVIGHLDPAKDVDGQHPANLGRLVQRQRAFVPSTALGGLRLLEHYQVPLRGARVVVVGRSAVVGLPLALLLVQEDATVSVCHTRTRSLADETGRANVLCVAAGRAGLIGAEHVAPGAVVLDFGTNPVDGGLVGDVRADEVDAVAGALTPVPGGTGPVTVAVLAEQTLDAAERRAALG